IMYFLIGKKTKIKLKRTYLKIERNIIVPCMTLGLSTFIMQASESVIAVCFNSSLLKYGGDIAVGSMTILTSVMQFALLPLQGIGQGAQPIISFNFGAKNKDRVKETFLLLVKISVGYSALLWLLVMIMPQVFVKMFTTSPELIAFTETSLRVYMGGLMLFGIQVACQMTFTSIGNAKGSIMVAVMRKFVLLIPLIYIMPRFLENKTMAVYMAEPIADILAVLFTSILFIFQFKKILKDM
ncbi:MAG: MATE family efflux transporter, partial [Peptacetobacter hiranonis]|nr:MATE family efflux transporter [Peptacetobacter hiranonis]